MDRELLLLGLLRHQEMHGYQLNEFIDSQMHFRVHLKRSTAYYLLDKLCRDGYVSEEIERAGNRPERKVYRITAVGEQLFQRLLRENLSSYEPPTYAQDVGIIFLKHMPAVEAAALLNQRRSALLEHRTQLDALRTTIPPDHEPVIAHHLLHLEAEQAWIDLLLEQVQHR